VKISGLIWLDDIVQKIARKHAVQREEVRQVFTNRNRPRFWFVEKGHRAGENVYSVSGRSDAGRYLIVFFIYKKDSRALILSARDMTDGERRRYGKK
jgi:hypothetical protein